MANTFQPILSDVGMDTIINPGAAPRVASITTDNTGAMIGGLVQQGVSAGIKLWQMSEDREADEFSKWAVDAASGETVQDYGTPTQGEEQQANEVAKSIQKEEAKAAQGKSNLDWQGRNQLVLDNLQKLNPRARTRAVALLKQQGIDPLASVTADVRTKENARLQAVQKREQGIASEAARLGEEVTPENYERLEGLYLRRLERVQAAEQRALATQQYQLNRGGVSSAGAPGTGGKGTSASTQFPLETQMLMDRTVDNVTATLYGEADTTVEEAALKVRGALSQVDKLDMSIDDFGKFYSNLQTSVDKTIRDQVTTAINIAKQEGRPLTNEAIGVLQGRLRETMDGILPDLSGLPSKVIKEEQGISSFVMDRFKGRLEVSSNYLRSVNTLPIENRIAILKDPIAKQKYDLHAQRYAEIADALQFGKVTTKTEAGKEIVKQQLVGVTQIAKMKRDKAVAHLESLQGRGLSSDKMLNSMDTYISEGGKVSPLDADGRFKANERDSILVFTKPEAVSNLRALGEQAKLADRNIVDTYGRSILVQANGETQQTISNFMDNRFGYSKGTPSERWNLKFIDGPDGNTLLSYDKVGTEIPPGEEQRLRGYVDFYNSTVTGLNHWGLTQKEINEQVNSKMFRDLGVELQTTEVTEETPKPQQTPVSTQTSFDISTPEQKLGDKVAAQVTETFGTEEEINKKRRATTSQQIPPAPPVEQGGVSNSLPGDKELLDKAVAYVESGFNPEAVSPKGARGIMQVMSATAKNPGYGIEPAKDDSLEELERVGKEYLGAMLKRFDNNLSDALVAYNWGPGNALKWIEETDRDLSKLPRETRDYIVKVKGRLEEIS